MYYYSNEAVYKNAITKIEFEASDIQNLFVWKNGMKLSGLKQKSLKQKNLSKIQIIHFLKSNENVDL